MILAKFIGILVLSAMVTFILLVFYIKALSVLSERLKKLFPNIGNQRSKKRQDSKIEVCCIYYFDNAYDFLKTKIVGISRVFGDAYIHGNRHDENKEGNSEYGNRNSKSPIHSKANLPRGKQARQPNANKTEFRGF